MNPKKVCNDVYCENDPNYPEEAVRSLNLTNFEHFFGVDFVETVSVRFEDSGEGLCSSRRRIVYPTRGKTRNGEFMDIVNYGEKYLQGVLIEECQ